MKNIQSIRQNPEGLHQRYVIRKVVRMKKISDYTEVPVTKLVDPNAEYFVMRLDTGGSDIEHIKACRIGIHAYADAIQNHIPKLADDLRKRYPLL